MTLIELIMLLDKIIIDIPKIPMMTEVMVTDSEGFPVPLSDLKVTIVDGKPTVILI